MNLLQALKKPEQHLITRATAPRYDETRYRISVHDSNEGCTLGQKFTSMLLFGVPMPASMRTTLAPVCIFPKVLGTRFAVDVFSETFHSNTIRNSEGFVLVFDVLSADSFLEMATKLWEIIDVKKQQLRANMTTTNPPAICIVGYEGSSGAWARQLTKAHLDELTRNSKARYFELKDWNQEEIHSIALALARLIHRRDGRPVPRPQGNLKLRQMEHHLKSMRNAIARKLGAIIR